MLKAKAEVFSAVLSGIAAIITPITNFGTVLAENDSIFDSGAMARIVTELSILMTAMFGGIQRIVRQVGDLDLGSDPTMLKSKAEVFSVILTGIAAIITPITTFGASITSTAGGFFSNSSAVTNSMVELGILMPILLRSVGTLATGLLNSLSRVSATIDPAKVKAATDALVTILTAVIGMISTIMSLFNGGNGIMQGAGLGGSMGALAGPVGAAAGAVLGGVAGFVAEQQQFQNKLDALKQIFDMLGPNLTIILGAISGVLRDIINLPNLNETGMKAAAVFAQMTQAIGSLLTAVAAMINNDSMSASTQLLSALADTSDPLTRALSSVTEFIGDGTRGLVKVIKDMFKSFSSIDQGQAERLGAVGPFLAGLSSIINPMLNSITTVAGMIRGKTPEEIENILLQVRLLISSIGRNISTVMETLPAIITAIDKITNVKEIGEKVNSLKGIFEAISSIVNTIMSVRPNAENGDIYGRVFEPAMNLLGWLFYKGGKIPGTRIEGHGEMLEGVLTGISNMNLPKGLLEKANTIKSTFEAIKAIADVATSLKTLGGNALLAPDVLNLPLSNLAIMINSLKSKYIFFGGTKHYNPLSSPGEYFGPLTSILAGITGKGTLLTNIKNVVAELLSSAKAITDQAITGGTAATATDVLNIPLGNLAIMINSLNSKKVLAGGREYDNPLTNPKFYFDPLASILTGITGKETLLTNIKNAVKELLKSAQELTELPLRATGIAPDILNIPLGNLAVIINSLKNEHITANGREYDNPLHKPELYFGPLASILTGITGKGAILTNIKDELTQLLNSAKTVAEQPIVTTSPNLSTSLVNMTSVLKTIDDYFAPSNDLGSVAYLLENIHNNTKGRISHDLGAVVRRYNALSRDLARINEVNIDASLTRLNTGLGRNRVVQIENAAANITINLDVKLRTEDIERALYERSQTGKAPGRPGTITQDSWNKLSTDTANH
jgi:hypothetical protein